MIVTNQGSTLTITDEVTMGSAWMHLILYGDEDLYTFSLTDSISTFELNIDGWFIVESYMLPEHTNVSNGRGYYIYKNGNVRYLYKDSILCNVSTEYSTYQDNQDASDLTNVFMLCNIETCLGSLNLDILNDYLNACNNCKTIDSQKADMVYMAYSTLQYMAKRGHFAEAQRLLNNINKCGYLCGQSNCVTPSTPCNCN